MKNLTVFEQNGQLLTDSREVAMTQEERNEYLLKHENFIRCARCKNLIHSSNKYCQYCGCPNEKELQAIKKSKELSSDIVLNGKIISQAVRKAICDTTQEDGRSF